MKHADTELTRAVDHARQLLSAMAEIDASIQSAHELEGGLIRCKLESISALTVAAADGQPLDAARKKLSAANEDIQNLDFRLAGLDKRREGMLPTLAAALEQLDRELPAFAKSLLPSFAARWTAASSEMAICLAMRAVFEHVIGPIDLLPAPEPTLAVTEPALNCLPNELREPVQLQRQLRSAIVAVESRLRERKTFEDRRTRDRRPSLIDRRSVYKARMPLTVSGRELKCGDITLGLNLGPSAEFYVERGQLVKVDE
jgi:hypothetical protein